MRSKNRIFAVIAGVGLTLVGAFHAKAVPISYSFSVTATGGPLAGVTENGTFTYDSSSIVPGGINIAAGLLTDLNFTWNLITYDQTTANTGFLGFDAGGNLSFATFGGGCHADGSCGIFPFTNNWFLELFAGLTSGSFTYATPEIFAAGGTSEASVAQAVPEPSTLTLFSVAGLILVCAARRSRRAGDYARSVE